MCQETVKKKINIPVMAAVLRTKLNTKQKAIYLFEQDGCVFYEVGFRFFKVDTNSKEITAVDGTDWRAKN